MLTDLKQKFYPDPNQSIDVRSILLTVISLMFNQNIRNCTKMNFTLLHNAIKTF
uniref:Uncharacterized protein n=1 Tax=Planktothrix pseudagardhii TaxID=132604 RepID=A0A9W4CI96_9CYAN|nr:hypothetical protein NO713_01805 [Planktothrix pseudagardhii]